MADSRRRRISGVAAFALVLLLSSGPACETAHAVDIIGGVVGGVSDLVQGVFAIPAGILAGTFGGPPIIGTVGGALGGAFRTVGLGLRGALKLVGVAIPLAAKAAPLIPLVL